jgi:SMODS-associating 2TM, beta-strand rich effector domain
MGLEEVKPNIKKIIAITSILTTSAIIFLLWLYEIPLDVSIKVFGHITIVTGIIQALFFLFFNHVWKYNIIPKWMRTYLDIPPNLNGRWKGECIRTGGSVFTFIVEIRQSYFNLSYQIFTNSHGGESRGSKVNTAVLFINSNGNYSVITTWYDGGSSERNTD